jgi:lipoic acid synthetase
MILGDICTRDCAFCGISHGQPAWPDPNEPAKIAAAVKKLGLNYVVITSVTRDDLPDGGAGQFAKVIGNLRLNVAVSKIEVLIPDLGGDRVALQKVLDARPDVLNHNVETVLRLYPEIRPQANYQRSLKLLKNAKGSGQVVYTKSGFMVGLGERTSEVEALLADLKNSGCDIVTIGQYLPPSRDHRPPERYVTPEEFAVFQAAGEKLGLAKVLAGPFVRSSYHAGETANEISTG